MLIFLILIAIAFIASTVQNTLLESRKDANDGYNIATTNELTLHDFSSTTAFAQR